MMLFHEVPLTCINQAAIYYHVPAALILSVIKQESGRNGEASVNKNGTYDLGVMQINSSWLPTLARYGITREQVQYDPCVNVQVGTWLLASAMAENNGWQGVGDYHSHTAKFNQQYRERIKTIYFHTMDTIEGRNV